MGFIQRLERNIAKLEKRIQKEEEKIVSLQQKYESHKITPAEFNLKKRKIDDHIRALNSRLRVLQGGIVGSFRTILNILWKRYQTRGFVLDFSLQPFQHVPLMDPDDTNLTFF